MIDRIVASVWMVPALAATLLAWPAPSRASIDTLPLSFEANRGQADPRAHYVGRGAGHTAFLTDDGARIVIARTGDRDDAIIDLHFDGGRARPILVPGALLPGTANYLRGGDPRPAIIDVPTYERVTYASVYPGIDVVFHGTQGALEYDLVVAPAADPRRIALRFGGADAAHVAADGALMLHARGRELSFRQPVAYQDIGGRRRFVEARYVLGDDGRVRFRTGRYDRRYPLVIDPVLALATNIWGAVSGVALDPAGNIYVAGSAWTADLPNAGGYQTQQAGTADAYVVKLNPAGTAALYATYLGVRRATTQGLGIVVDAAGSAYVTGITTSGAFPVTSGAYQSAGTTFVTKLKPAGNALAYSTLFSPGVAALALHADGSLALTGTTGSLATTLGAFQTAKLGATSPYVARLNATGSGLVYATFLGGSSNDEARAIAVDAAGNSYVAGVARSANFPTRNAIRATLRGATDAFVAKLDSTGAQLVYSTYLGGSVDERAFGIAVDGAGQATAVGWTTSSDFPVTPGVFQPRIGIVSPNVSNAFVTKFDAAGGLLWSSYLGGGWCQGSGAWSCFGIIGADEGIDVATAVATDAAGFTYVGGYATSTLFPQVDPIEDFPSGGDIQRVPFVARVRPGGGRLAYSVVVGKRTSTTSVNQIVLDGVGGIVAVGSTPGELFPLTAGAVLGPSTAFAFKLAPGAYTTFVGSSANPASSTHSIVLMAEVDAAAAGGTVTFRDGSNVLGTASVLNGAASLGIALAPGVHRITAVNSADGKVSPPHFQIVSGQ